MKPVNWISETGRKPCAARPTETPAMSPSASGVSRTRSAPKRSRSPSVARNTPPSAPTSSPSNRTEASSAIARVSARLTAWTSVISGIGTSLARQIERHPALLGKILWQIFISEIEHRLGRLRWRRKIGLSGPFDRQRDFGEQLLFVGLAPHAGGDEIVAQARDRLFGPARTDLGAAAIAARIVGGGMVPEAVSQRLDQMRTAARPRLGDRTLDRLANGDDVIAVDLLAFEACRDRLLRQGLRCRLLGERHRDRPAVVVDDKHDRQVPHPGGVERLGDIALRGRTVAKDTHGDPFLAPQLEGEPDAYRVRRVRCDRNADGKILACLGKVAAALVAAPEQEQLDRADAAPELRAVLAEAWQQHVFRAHCAGDADRDRLLPQGRGKSTEPAGALQRHRLRIEASRQYHRPIEGDQLRAVRGEIGQRAHRVALGIEKAAVADLKLSDGGRDLAAPRFDNRR